MSKVLIKMIQGQEGTCLTLSADGGVSGLRVAGPKPWGGGEVVRRWSVDADRFLADVAEVVAKAKEGR